MAERADAPLPASSPPSWATLEPARAVPDARQEPRLFRIHHAPRPPYDWQLRLQGEDASIALRLPRGLPWGEDEARAAEPNAEASQAPVWDEGRYEVLESAAGELVVRLEGSRVRGRYRLEPASTGWRFRRLDPASLKPMPDRVLPMLAHPASYPKDEENYAFEIKWDGIRALANVREGQLALRSRNLASLTLQFPEIQELPPSLRDRSAVLDGEIIGLDASGRPSFQRLQGRMGVTSRSTAAHKSREVPAIYMVFDVLYLDGHDLTTLPYEERREILESLSLETDHWKTTPSLMGSGRSLLAMPEWEGIVAKRLGSAYEPGARSRAWLKIKAQKRQELVIGGFTWGRGARRGRIGALLMGYYDEERRFHYAGKVGTGFTRETLEDLERLLLPHRLDESPFVEDVGEKHPVFVAPERVAEIEFTEWTREGRLRHPSYKGLRDDKDARDVTREEA